MGETQSQTGIDSLQDVDDALTREVDQLARRYPHVDRDEIDRQVHATYRDLESRATIHSHLVTVTAGHVADRLRDQSTPDRADEVVAQPPDIGTYEEQPAGAPTELELEEQRAGVDTGTNPVSEQIASPLWVVGLGPPSGGYGRSSARTDSAIGRPGVVSRIRSMLASRHR
jgi:Protein-tyrosine-phosphatase-like, N-terminal domain